MSVREHNEKKEIGNILTANEYRELDAYMSGYSLFRNTDLSTAQKLIENSCKEKKKVIKSLEKDIEKLTHYKSRVEYEINNHIYTR